MGKAWRQTASPEGTSAEFAGVGDRLDVIACEGAFASGCIEGRNWMGRTDGRCCFGENARGKLGVLRPV